jgi:SAM-dependent methyltransferase
MHFDAHAESYDEARPPYPPALWDSIRELGAMRPGLHALDLGAGTGQATGPLLAAGLSVTAVEPGPRLAALLRRAHPDAEVVIARAEEAELPANTFDVVVAATSIHWMDLDVLLPRIHRAMTPSATLLVWRTVFGDPAVTTPFRELVARIVNDRTSPPRPGPDPEDHAVLTARLIATGHFSVELSRTFRWCIELSDDQVLRLFTTFSDWTAAEAERAGAGRRELGGRVVEHYSTFLIALRPI